MHDAEQPAVVRRGPFAALVFWSVSVLLIPVMLLGYVLWIGKL